MRIVALSTLLVVLSGCRAPTKQDLLGTSRGFDLVIDGNEVLTRGEVERAVEFDLSEFEENGYGRAFADDVAYQALAHYRQKGFPFAAVEYSVEGTAARPVLTLHVVEGPRTLLDEERITAEGVNEFTDVEVRSFFNGPRTGLLGRGDLLYVASRVSAVPRAMEREYVARGYLDAAELAGQAELGTTVHGHRQDQIWVLQTVQDKLLGYGVILESAMRTNIPGKKHLSDHFPVWVELASGAGA